MHWTVRLVVCVVLGLLVGAAAAQTVPADGQPALPLEVGAPRLNVFDHVYIVDAVDLGEKLGDPQFLARLDAVPIGAVLSPGENALGGPLWARLRVMNAGDERAQWRLDTLTGWGVLADAYVVRPGQAPRLVLANNWEDRGFDQRYPRTLRPASAPVDLAPGETVDIWLDLPYGLVTNEPFWLRDEASFEQDRLADASFETAVFGFRLALAAGIFAFAAVLRSRLAFYYGLFSTLLTTFFLNTSGYIYAYVLKDTDFDALFYTANGLGIIVVFAMMIQENIKAPKSYPRYNAALLGSLVLAIAAGVVTNWLALPDLAFHLLRAACLALFVGIALYGAYIGVRDRHPGARQFLLATVVLFAIVVTGLMSWPPFYLFDVETMNAVQLVAFTADALLFASALVSRAIELRRARDAAVAAELRAMSERALVAEQLALARDEHADAVRLAEARRRQLASTSHDIAQPLVSLQMSLKKMQGAEGVAEGLSFLESVVRRNLSESRTDAAPAGETTAPAKATAFALDQTLRNVTLMFADEAQAKGVALRHVPTTARVLCEPLALMRIVVNLVANAIQHSDGGRVLMGVRREGGAVHLQVADNGAGMTPEQAEAAFTPYVAGTSSRGEGLGLAVTKALAETQGFSISVRSEPGRGSLFTVGPIAQAPAA